MGALARLCKAPPVVGEILAGIVLGQTVLGRLLPGAHAALFPATGAQAEALQAVSLLGVVLLLFVAGLEVDVRMAFRRKGAAVATSLLGVIVPFAAGMGLVRLLPAPPPGVTPLSLAL